MSAVVTPPQTQIFPPVELAAPDLSPWTSSGSPRGFHSFAAAEAGPHVGLVALVHGNEIAGACALLALLRAGVRPRRGRLTFGFANLDAFERFDPSEPTASRFVDEDFNRLWDATCLDGPRRSAELTRAREIRAVIEQMDILLDLHSMLWPSDPLILCGPTAKGARLGCGIGHPPVVVSDYGHRSGKRLIDYAPFVSESDHRQAVLVESGQHWQPSSVDQALLSVTSLLVLTGQIDRREAAGLVAPVVGRSAPSAGAAPSRFAEVTMAVTATTASFVFTDAFRGGEIVPRQGTLIARDGSAEIRTPHDDCLLVMPSLRPSRGHTAVRLARFV